MNLPNEYKRQNRRGILTIIFLAVAVLATACASDENPDAAGGLETSDGIGALDGTTITVYSGRGEDLIGPIFELFEQRTGAKIEARYGGSADMALLIDTEGTNSPADVFISQSPGAVGFLDQAGRLAPLGSATLARLDADFKGTNGTWAGVTGRVRVLIYNTDAVSPDELPASVLDLTEPEYAGRVAIAPNNGSFQDFVTAMRSELGDEDTLAWLEGMAENQSPNYAKNSAIVDAVSRGEVDMGLVNHYYLLRSLKEDPSITAENYSFPDGDLGSLVIVTAAAVLDTSNHPDAAQELVAFLLSDEAQSLAAQAQSEYPLVTGIPQPSGLTPLSQLAASAVDLNLLADGLAGTQELIEASDITQ